MYYTVTVTYNGRVNSHAHSAYDVAVAAVAEARQHVPDRELDSSVVVSNDLEHCHGVFGSLEEAVAAVQRYTGLPWIAEHGDDGLNEIRVRPAYRRRRRPRGAVRAHTRGEALGAEPGSE
jgi:hypothetical protein